MVFVGYPEHAVFHGQYSTHAGDPAQPVQHSVITASSFGFFLRGVAMPLERGSCFNASDTIPVALTTSGSFAMCSDYAPASIKQRANAETASEYESRSRSPGAFHA